MVKSSSDLSSSSVSRASAADWSFSCPQLSESGKIVFVGHSEKPFRLGQIYCTNRPSSIFTSDVEIFPKFEKIENPGYASNTPIFINETDFIYFRRDDWGPHADYHTIVKRSGESETELVQQNLKMTEIDESKCPGILPVGIDKGSGNSGILVKSNSAFLTTKWLNRSAIVKINLENGEITTVKADQNLSCKLTL
jgi:hypothetical protein